MDIFLDESGYSGTNLMASETVFVLASCTLTDEQSDELYKQVFGNLPPNAELKHAELRRTNPDLVVDFVRHVVQKYPKMLGGYAVLKKYALVAKMVDSWIETSFYEEGLDFYQNNGHRACAILLFYSLMTLETPSFMREFLILAQTMMNSRSEADAKKFFDFIESSLDMVNPETAPFFEMLLLSAKHLGYAHIEMLSKSALDLCIPALMATTAYWRNSTNDSLVLMHDKASELEQMKKTWEGMSAADVPPSTMQTSDGEIWQFPLNVSKTEFVDSVQHKQVQFCDLIAGAMAEALRFVIGDHCDPAYAQKFLDAGIETLLIGCVWPFLADATIEDETVDHQGQIDYFMHLLKKVTEKNNAKNSRKRPEFDFVQESDKARRCLKEGKNEEAFKHIEKLAGAKLPFFQLLLSQMYESGTGIAANLDKSKALLFAAAKTGFPPAERALALAYLRGDKIPQNLPKAVELMTKAAEGGDPYAQHDLGTFYHAGDRGLEKSMEKGCDWHEKAAAQDFPDSQRELASAYMHGDGRPKDRNIAYGLYLKAATAGDMMAQYYIGQMHQHGDHCKKSMKEAFRWWKFAAEQGQEVAQFNVALMLLNGDGAVQDLEQGLEWLKKSASANYPQAIKALPKVEEKIRVARRRGK